MTWSELTGLSFYVDGCLVSNTKGSTKDRIDDPKYYKLMIGTNPGNIGTSDGAEIVIDEVQIWLEELSVTQIWTSYLKYHISMLTLSAQADGAQGSSSGSGYGSEASPDYGSPQPPAEPDSSNDEPDSEYDWYWYYYFLGR